MGEKRVDESTNHIRRSEREQRQGEKERKKKKNTFKSVQNIKLRSDYESIWCSQCGTIPYTTLIQFRRFFSLSLSSDMYTKEAYSKVIAEKLSHTLTNRIMLNQICVMRTILCVCMFVLSLCLCCLWRMLIYFWLFLTKTKNQTWRKKSITTENRCVRVMFELQSEIVWVRLPLTSFLRTGLLTL